MDLAKLARIEIGSEEAENLSHEFDAILSYVGEVKQATSDHKPVTNDHAIRNVLREDVNPHEPDLYTEKILEQAPAREGDYIKVKKIL